MSLDTDIATWLKAQTDVPTDVVYSDMDPADNVRADKIHVHIRQVEIVNTSWGDRGFSAIVLVRIEPVDGTERAFVKRARWMAAARRMARSDISGIRQLQPEPHETLTFFSSAERFDFGLVAWRIIMDNDPQV